MDEQQLIDAVATLSTSSAFRHGDAGTFSVAFLRHQAELPGPADPQRYLRSMEGQLGFKVAEDDSVAIVGAGNGGLVAEALLAGAEQAVAIEPRARYREAVDQVVSLLRETHERVDVKTYLGWPSPKSTLGPFDLILWPEGLDECTDPAVVLANLLKCLRPEGLLCVEVTHGENTKLEAPLNSFRPTEDAWAELLDQLGVKVAAQGSGRAQNRVLYRLDAGKAVKAPAPKPKPKPAPLPPFPKPVPPKAAPKPMTTPMPEKDLSVRAPDPEPKVEETKPPKLVPKPVAKPKAVPKVVEGPKPAEKPKVTKKKTSKKTSSRVKKEEAAPPPPAPAEKPKAEPKDETE